MNIRHLSCDRTVQLLTLCISAAIALPAQTPTFTTVHTFDTAGGDIPYGLLQAVNGDLYGIANQGGANYGKDTATADNGAIFNIKLGRQDLAQPLRSITSAL